MRADRLQGRIQLQRDTLTTPFKEICISVIYHIGPEHFCKVNKSWLNKKYQSSRSGASGRERRAEFIQPRSDWKTLAERGAKRPQSAMRGAMRSSAQPSLPRAAPPPTSPATPRPHSPPLEPCHRALRGAIRHRRGKEREKGGESVKTNSGEPPRGPRAGHCSAAKPPPGSST